MNIKLVGLLVAMVVILLGLLVMMLRATPEAPAPVAVTAPPPIEQPKPNPRGGSYKKTPPGKYEYTTPK